MKQFISIAVLISFLSAQTLSATSLPQKQKVTSEKIVSIALVPFAETYSGELEEMLQSIESNLSKSPKLRILPRHKTDEIIDYYRTAILQDASSKDISDNLHKARASLLVKDYDAMDKYLSASEKELLSRREKGQSIEGLGQTYLLKVKYDRFLENNKRAVDDFEKLVTLNPDITLDKGLYSSWEVSRLEEAKKRVESRGVVKIETDPIGSEVFLNGYQKGISPLVLENIPAGTHILEIKTFNYATLTRKVEVKENTQTVIREKLQRTTLGVVPHQTIKPSSIKNEQELSRVITSLGYHLGVDKVVLVASKKEGKNSIVYRLGDSRLGAAQKVHEVATATSQQVDLLVDGIARDAALDLRKNPSKFVDQTLGSIELHEKKKKPIYKKALFWVLVAAGASGAGVAAALLTGTTAAATTGGVVIGL